MTDRNKWMYDGGGTQIYNEDGSKTKSHPDFKKEKVDLSSLNITYVEKEEWFNIINNVKTFLKIKPDVNFNYHEAIFVSEKEEIFPLIVCGIKYRELISKQMGIISILPLGCVDSKSDIVTIKSSTEKLGAKLMRF